MQSVHDSAESGEWNVLTLVYICNIYREAEKKKYILPIFYGMSWNAAAWKFVARAMNQSLLFPPLRLTALALLKYKQKKILHVTEIQINIKIYVKI